MRRTRQDFTAKFKRDAAALVQQQGYSIRQAWQTRNVGDTALRHWVAQMTGELAGTTPIRKALTPEQQAAHPRSWEPGKAPQNREAHCTKSTTFMADIASFDIRS